MRHLLFFLVILSLSSAFSQTTPIIDLHINDSQGVPAAPYGVGTAVTIEGIVTASTGIFSATNFEIYVQDETAGINCFEYGRIPAEVNLGDRVRVSGKIQHYCGLTEISDISSVEILSTDNPVPDPIVLTCSALAFTFQDDYSEPNEGRLVRINNVEIVEGDPPVWTIADQSGTCLLFIDPDTDLTLPRGKFDVIGILKQYDTTKPFTSGYEISPRFASDLLQLAGPKFLSQPVETKIQPTFIEFHWTTDKPSSTILQYGKTSDLELGSAGDSARVTEHTIRVDKLAPATIYHGLALSSSETGTTQSDPFIFSTASDESSGEISVFFTRSVNSDLAMSQPAQGNINLADVIINRIQKAQKSLDACFYSITRDDIIQALVDAYNRGVSVRFIGENENKKDDMLKLEQAGIPVITDDFGRNDGNGYMHNKFIIADYRGTDTGADDWLLTGSANATYSGTENNAENLIVINDQALCAAYTKEFNEMWGSNDSSPDPVKSRFGDRKENNTPHRFQINGILFEQYMSPSDNTEKYIIAAAQTANRSIDFCIYSFTSNAIEKIMRDKFYNVSGFLLRGVFDQGAISHFGAAYESMAGLGNYAWTQPADVHTDNFVGLLHHKYMIIDAPFPQSSPVVVTGSHNWSISANTRNDENTLIIHNANIANQFYQEFAARYQNAGGNSDITVDVKQTTESCCSFRLKRNYPNPFNNGTVLSVSISQENIDHNRTFTIVINDLLGRTVREIRFMPKRAGIHKILWDGKNSSGSTVSSGIYFARIRGAEQIVALKMVLIR